MSKSVVDENMAKCPSQIPKDSLTACEKGQALFQKIGNFITKTIKKVWSFDLLRVT